MKQFNRRYSCVNSRARKKLPYRIVYIAQNSVTNPLRYTLVHTHTMDGCGEHGNEYVMCNYFISNKLLLQQKKTEQQKENERQTTARFQH